MKGGRFLRCKGSLETLYQLLGVHHLCPEVCFGPQLIADGYRLPFVKCPDKCYLRNNRSAVRHSQFVQEAIPRLLLNDRIQKHYEPPYCVNHLSVAEGKKLRLVIDLRHVNPCLFKHSFRYEELHCLSKVFEQNFCFFTWGL